MIHRREAVLERILQGAAWASALVPLAVLAFLLAHGLPLLTGGNFWRILLSPWAPGRGQYGIAPMIAGSLGISTLAMCCAVPLSLGYALLLCGVAPRRLARLLGRLAGAMSGVPTVVYGFVGIFLLVPLVRQMGGRGSGMCVLSAGLLLALLIAPTMILFFRDSLMRVPASYARAVRALGGTTAQEILLVRLPQARCGIVAGCLLAFGRALGDTLVALMIAGNTPLPPASLLDPARTLTAHIALVFAADTESMEFRAVFACGLTLYLLVSLLTLLARVVLGKREASHAARQ